MRRRVDGGCDRLGGLGDEERRAGVYRRGNENPDDQ